tara:strand:+ start:438 stop:932 length:495 start_codon:yes stop_codon:yes gene_type:complete
MKLVLLIILTASVFAQDKSNQNSYSIYADTGYYHNVILHQVKSSNLIAQNKSSTKKYTIPISSINKIKIKETGSTNLGKVFCVSLGAYGGAVIALLSNGGFAMGSPDATTSSSDTAVVWGGLAIGIWIGNKFGSSLFGRQTEFVSFKNKTLAEKRNYLKSKVNQ